MWLLEPKVLLEVGDGPSGVDVLFTAQTADGLAVCMTLKYLLYYFLACRAVAPSSSTSSPFVHSPDPLLSARAVRWGYSSSGSSTMRTSRAPDSGSVIRQNSILLDEESSLGSSGVVMVR